MCRGISFYETRYQSLRCLIVDCYIHPFRVKGLQSQTLASPKKHPLTFAKGVKIEKYSKGVLKNSLYSQKAQITFKTS